MQKIIGYFLLAGLCANAVAASDPDSSFGAGGVRRYGFAAVDGGRTDRGAVACPGPEGSLFAAGTASLDRRIVSVWLAEDGNFDERFSEDGKESFGLPAGQRAYGETGLCGSDGKVILAYESVIGEEGRITLWRLDPATGLPDAAFGTGGRVDVDLDAYATGLGTIESVATLSPGRNGDVIVTGWYDRPGDPSSGFVVRVTSTGVVAAVALADAFDASNKDFMAAMPAPDGSLWVAGATHGSPRGGEVVSLDYATLAWRSTPVPQLPDGFEPRGGRQADANTFLLTGRIDEAAPAVAQVTPAGASVLRLPAVPGAKLVVTAQVVPLSNGTFVVAADLVDALLADYGFYFAGVRRHRGALALEPTFGSDGARLVPPTFATGCTPQEFSLSRMTVWRDRPLWFGYARVCEPDAPPHDDYLFFRLTRSDLIFRGGFD